LPPVDYQPLGRTISAPGSVQRLGEVVRGLGAVRVLLVTDPGLEKTGHPQRAERAMVEAGLTVTTFDGVKENPTEKEVIAGVAVAREAGIDCIVAVGGGSSMDCAKGINFLLTNGGKMEDYKGHGKATKPMLPSVGVPTTSGTGSEAQS
jgi:alcohol dehydrogenase